MKFKKVVALGAAVGVALSGIALASPAYADPVSNSYSIVGSDTLDSVTNALVNGTSVTGPTVRITSAGASIGSYDAFGSPLIQTKANGVYFGRPAGSSAGRDALRRSMDGAPYAPGGSNPTPAKVITGQVDIARSSSGPGSGNISAAGKLLYVPFARDAVSYAYKGGTAAWATLTPSQLKQIFDGTLTSVDGVAVNPRLPQTGSGTRTFWLGALGYTGTTAPGVSDVGNVTPENDASVLAAGDIIPFSVANWVAQANNVTSSNTTTVAGVALGSPVSGEPGFSGTGSALVPNADFYANTTFGRDTYLIVERARVTVGDSKYDAKLANLVDTTKATGLTSFASLIATQPGSIKKKFGFVAPLSSTPISAFAAG
ncbi:hypothetical protein WJX64_14550 [Leifsonia sp. YIM 134122]|uniref:PBP domain-containing protein n=1 Tax=Leifsonia stereocauli TaxID=3134136 RepID=A0ABU9W6Z2_9MICO